MSASSQHPMNYERGMKRRWHTTADWQEEKETPARCDGTFRWPGTPHPDKNCGAINQTSIREIEELWRGKHAALELDLVGPQFTDPIPSGRWSNYQMATLICSTFLQPRYSWFHNSFGGGGNVWKKVSIRLTLISPLNYTLISSVNESLI